MKLKVNNVPKISDSVYYTEKENKHLFLNQDLPNWVVLNQNSAYVTAMIDGERTIKDIHAELEKSGINLEINDILNLFQDLNNHGIINDDNKVIKPVTQCNTYQKSNLHIVHLQLTNACNLSCRYCFAESGKSESSVLTLDRIKEVVSEIEQISSHASYTITGGEPLKSPYSLDVLNYLYEKNKEIILLTNGLLVTEENVETIAKTCNLIKISIDGSTEEINAKTRGRGGFAKALHGYELLKKRGANVLVSMTVTKKNIHDISNMVKLFGNRLTLQPFFKAGRGTENEDLQITGREYYEALASVEGLQPMGQIGTMLNGLRGRGTTKCAMADGEIYIAENGDVYPCQMLMEDEFKGGNIDKDSIFNILDSDVFKELRNFSSLDNEECSTCHIKLLCGGACRARSYLDTGSIFKNSDFCEYEKLAYINGIFEVSEFN